ncbi:MAG: phospholipase D-like domain-containing protein [Candidatus Nanoarchaeia archaeon]
MKKLSSESELDYKYFKDTEAFYSSIIKDIEKAKFYIYLETFRYDSSKYPKMIRAALDKAAERGVEIKLLIDGWGAQVDEKFFSELIKHNGELRFFRKPKLFTYNIIKYNNRRDHRKIIAIDDKIVYLSSANIAERNLHWREFSIRIEGHIAGMFKDIFLDNYELHKDFYHDKRSHIFPLTYGSFEIVRDVPSARFRMVRKKLKNLIIESKKEILLETPYFVPDHRFLHALKEAARRGVKVTLIIPKRSDVMVTDIMASSYMGTLHRSGVKIKYYTKGFNHSKIALIDDEYFSFGSTNLDHRSFGYMYELNVFGKEKRLKDIVKKHIEETLKGTEDFDYKKWKRRGLHTRLLEILLWPMRSFM